MPDKKFLPSQTQIRHMINLFTKNNKLNAEDLRLYTKKQFTHIYTQFEEIIHSPQKQTYWQKLRDFGITKQIKNTEEAFRNIFSLLDQIDLWYQKSVRDKPTFEFFIRSKAAELNSGDQIKDYYHALMIRHDQLLAVVFYFSQALFYLRQSLEKTPKHFFDSQSFKYFATCSSENQIYLVAELFYQVRIQNQEK